MKKLRSYILKLCLIGLVCSGLSLAATQPLQASSTHRNFTHWLETIARQADDAHIEKRLAALRQSNNLYRLIKEASRIIEENNEEFNFSDASSGSSGAVYQLLLVKWSRYQTGSDMAKVPAPERIKPHFTAQNDKYSSGHQAVLYGLAKIVLSSFFDTSFRHDLPAEHGLSPLASGIAIGAP